MKKQQLIEALKEEYNDYHPEYNYDIRTGLAYAIKLAHQLDEPEKVIIPQFVAEAFEKAKGDNWFASPLVTAMYKSSDEVGYWLEVPSNEKLLLRAWLDGYEIEKEKLYYVLNKRGETLLMFMGGEVKLSVGFRLHDGNKEMYQLTEKQIKEIDERYWPFAVEVAE